MRATANMPVPRWGRGYPERDNLAIRFNTLPITRAKADTDSAVWEFDGAANADEPGAGGGLAGANLVLTQYGGVPAADGGGRSFTAASMYFKPTGAMLNNFNIADNLSVIYQASHLTADGEMGYPVLNGFVFSWSGSPLRLAALTSLGGGLQTSLRVGCGAPAYPFNGIFWHVLTLNNTDGIGFAGIAIKDTLPDKISDFLATSVFFNAAHNYTSTETLSAEYQGIVGSSYSSQSALYKIRSLTVSKLPFVSKA
jgi:hypothetical protein